MKTIGLIGGMSFESTAIYYRLINEDVRARLGGHHSAKLILWSVDFAEIEVMQRGGEWDKAGTELGAAARRLDELRLGLIEQGCATAAHATEGADLVILCGVPCDFSSYLP